MVTQQVFLGENFYFLKFLSTLKNIDRPPMSSRIATTDRPESNVSFSLSCTKTSIQIAQQNKPDETDGNKTQRNDYSSINTHEQSTSVGSENENLSRLSSVDLQEHASTIKKELSNTTAGSPTNANGMRIKPNLLNYIGFTCLEQANSGPFADALIAKEIHKDFLYLITNGGTMEL
ncbi:unnamed protein product [Rotaria socialis]|uniref:Uncharacterized protein n=1 Tax=Rotaria socialis TaxID=392032 RepID=A0A818IVC0_9BILA|nr:unnamed protein product [Rotaria socialis]